jgi:CBS domain-containing protein
MRISEVMHVHLPVLSPASTVREAVDKMDIYQFPALVIVDDERRPLAVITEGRLAEAAKACPLAELSSAPAMEFAHPHPYVAGVNDEVDACLRTMIEQNLELLPVVADGRLMGVALRVDLLQALFTALASPSTEG